jgi:hypothetical protein
VYEGGLGKGGGEGGGEGGEKGGEGGEKGREGETVMNKYVRTWFFTVVQYLHSTTPAQHPRSNTHHTYRTHRMNHSPMRVDVDHCCFAPYKAYSYLIPLITELHFVAHPPVGGGEVDRAFSESPEHITGFHLTL